MWWILPPIIIQHMTHNLTSNTHCEHIPLYVMPGQGGERIQKELQFHSTLQRIKIGTFCNIFPSLNVLFTLNIRLVIVVNIILLYFVSFIYFVPSATCSQKLKELVGDHLCCFSVSVSWEQVVTREFKEAADEDFVSVTLSHESRILQLGDSFTPPPMSANTYVRHPHLSMFLSVSPQCGFTRSFHEFYDVLYTQCIHNVLHMGFVELSCFQWRETFPLRGSSFPGRLVMDCWELAHLPPLPPPGLKTQMLNISMQL